MAMRYGTRRKISSGSRLTRAKLLGFAAVFAGVLLVNGSVRGGSADATGLLCGAASAALYAVMITENRRAVHITGQENAALQILGAVLILCGAAGAECVPMLLQRHQKC